MNKKTFGRALCATALASLLWGCATTGRQVESVAPETILAEICQPGAGLQHVQGEVWMSVSSEREGSARFPARVDVRRAGELRLEVTNLLGGPEALVRVTDDSIEVRKQGEAATELRRSPDGNWNGIPIRWAKGLFLGEVPCAIGGARQRPARRLEEDRLEVKSGQERFEYTWKLEEGRFTAQSLVWERGQDAKVEFQFKDFEEGSRVAKQWEARSASGTVKVRWKDRQAVR